MNIIPGDLKFLLSPSALLIGLYIEGSLALSLLKILVITNIILAVIIKKLSNSSELEEQLFKAQEILKRGLERKNRNFSELKPLLSDKKSLFRILIGASWFIISLYSLKLLYTSIPLDASVNLILVVYIAAVTIIYSIIAPIIDLLEIIFSEK